MTDENLPRKAKKGGKSRVSITIPEGKKSGDKISFKLISGTKMMIKQNKNIM